MKKKQNWSKNNFFLLVATILQVVDERARCLQRLPCQPQPRRESERGVSGEFFFWIELLHAPCKYIHRDQNRFILMDAIFG